MSEFRKKFNVFIPLLFAIVLIVGIYWGFRLREHQGYKFRFSGKSSVIRQILNLTELKYVDSIQIKDLRSDAIQGILNHLDPHSVYIPPSRLAEVNAEMNGSFQGIGVAFTILRDTLNVTQVIPGGPSQSVGLKIGDKIIRVNDSLIAGVNITANKIKRLLRGQQGTKVRVKIFRNGEILPFTIERGVIPLYSIDAAYMIAPGTGYIRINRFAASTYGEFMDAIMGLKKNGLKRLIIDLRENPGGYMKAAVNIADEFLSGQKLVVYTKGKSYPRQDYTSGKTGVFEDGPLAVLVDGRSASASEILAGAIQDWDRGTVIGRRTFGKGLVQEQYHLSNDGALRLTVARYYLPSGRCIQKPYKHRMKNYDEDLMNRFEHGELSSADSIHFSDTTHYYTKVGHRRVYGGGGIMPDVFIPIDTTKMTDIIMSLYAGNILYNFAYTYYSQHKTDFFRYKTADTFVKDEKISPGILKAFKQFAQQQGISHVDKLNSSDLQYIKLRIKALIARERWQEEGYYQVMNTQDQAVQKAIEVLKME